CGLHLLTPAERDPLRTTSFGLGALVAVAVESGVRDIVIGLGGSATNDAGAGLLASLGAPPLDEAGYALPYGGAAPPARGGPPRGSAAASGPAGRGGRCGQPTDRPGRRQRGVRPAEGRLARRCRTARFRAASVRTRTRKRS